MRVRFRFLLLVLCIFAIVGCPKQPGQDEFIEIERLSENARLSKFSSYPVDRQIDIFLFAQINMAGKGETYLHYLTNNAETKTIQIVARIDATERVSFKADLLRVLEAVDLRCACVHSDSSLMRILMKNDVEAETTDPPDVRLSKELYTKILDRLKLRTAGAASTLRQ